MEKNKIFDLHQGKYQLEVENCINQVAHELNINISNDNFDILPLIEYAERTLDNNKNLNNITEMYAKIGDCLLIRHEMKYAYDFYLKAYKSLNDNNDNLLVIVTISFSKICFALGKFNEAKYVIDNTLLKKNEISQEKVYILLYNKIRMFHKLKEFDAALKEINKINEKLLCQEEIYDLKSIQSDCLFTLGKYDEAMKVCMELLNNNMYNDISEKLVLLCNIIDLFIQFGDKKSVKKYLDYVMKDLNHYKIDIKRRYSAQIYYEAGLDNIYVGNVNTGMSLLNQSLEYCKENNRYNLEMKCIDKLFNIYKDNSKINLIYNLEKYLVEVLEKNNMPKYYPIVEKFICFYNSYGKFSKADALKHYVNKKK